MSKLDELLKKEKVEWKTIGSLIEKHVEKQRDNPDIKLVYTVSKDFGLISSNEFWKNNIDRQDDYTVYSEDIANYNVIRKNMFAYNPSRLNIGSIDCLLDREEGVLSPMYVIFKVNESIINPLYLKYYIQSPKILKKIDNKKEHGARFRFDFERWNLIKIPIPSIETQEKIVKILDKFTEYVAELQSELQDRTKQYAYFRDRLLSEDYLNKLSNNPKILGGRYRLRTTTLGDIGFFTRGNGLQKKDFVSKGKPVIHYGQIYTKYNFQTDTTFSFVNEEVFSKLKKAKYNDILIATTSENIEDVGKAVVWIGHEEIGFSGDMYSYRTSENSKYIAYYLQTAEFQKQKERKVTGTKLIRIHGDAMAKFSIALPPIEIQNKVVEVLDKFQSFLSDTQGLLPQEIEERQKQYEYYREKLLTFDENMVASKQASKQDNI
ncbi:MAG: restriction endonuclease subunit S [Peptoniphilus sp.]|nr:restriction endonuclease subunit S [Peptoniphilus sp.]MDY3118054.1 restriction endonuclease subunit S [Peptoniphilus sp.]